MNIRYILVLICVCFCTIYYKDEQFTESEEEKHE